MDYILKLHQLHRLTQMYTLLKKLSIGMELLSSISLIVAPC